MKRVAQRFAMGAAQGFGYAVLPSGWFERLKVLRGEYRAPRSRQILLWAVSGMEACVAVFAVAMAWRAIHVDHNDVAAAGLGVSAVGVSLISVLIGRRAGCYFVFSGGTLEMRSASGDTRWRDSLLDLQRVSCTQMRDNVSLTLVWADHKRRIEVFDSLRRALDRESH